MLSPADRPARCLFLCANMCLARSCASGNTASGILPLHGPRFSSLSRNALVQTSSVGLNSQYLFDESCRARSRSANGIRIVIFFDARASLISRCTVPRCAEPPRIASPRFCSTSALCSSHQSASSASLPNSGTFAPPINVAIFSPSFFCKVVGCQLPSRLSPSSRGGPLVLPHRPRPRRVTSIGSYARLRSTVPHRLPLRNGDRSPSLQTALKTPAGYIARDARYDRVGSGEGSSSMQSNYTYNICINGRPD